MEEVIRLIDEMIDEAHKEPTWTAEQALRCLKKEIKEREATVRNFRTVQT